MDKKIHVELKIFVCFRFVAALQLLHEELLLPVVSIVGFFFVSQTFLRRGSDLNCRRTIQACTHCIYEGTLLKLYAVRSRAFLLK